MADKIERKVEANKNGWAVVEIVRSGYLVGMKTVVSIHKTKKEAEDAAYG